MEEGTYDVASTVETMGAMHDDGARLGPSLSCDRIHCGVLIPLLIHPIREIMDNLIDGFGIGALTTTTACLLVVINLEVLGNLFWLVVLVAEREVHEHTHGHPVLALYELLSR